MHVKGSWEWEGLLMMMHLQVRHEQRPIMICSDEKGNKHHIEEPAPAPA
jgi:hypothetical protein